MNNKVPVVLVIYKRMTALAVLEKIREYEPSDLYIVAGGGITSAEHEVCLNVRSAVENMVDWPCQMHKLYSDINLGCSKTIVRGLDWVFDQVDRAIILEDDCVPSKSFFPFCEEMLTRYENDTRIWTISGFNAMPSNKCFNDYSYTFSGHASQWGWASWKRAWSNYDIKIDLWPTAKKQNILNNLFLSPIQQKYWEEIFDSIYHNTCSFDVWDYQWIFMSWINNALSVVPNKSLVTNIGFGKEATHTKDEHSPLAKVKNNELVFPLVHPPYISRNAEYDKNIVKYYGRTSIFRSIRILFQRYLLENLKRGFYE
ncbi:hypothetical protein [Methanosarcina vacuolata]|uniref:HlpA protein n=1 Tax=Methanosarcina vacuolata Z-761 TaxID=1434123 RepID=A0A0E3Q6A1_9EURY|nr:hypothetical protein [Methanosarcina vacuolata]AKB45102.1 hypothetical protein MSVAZ_2833 [Methanosarcina vacuolata Z-761]